MGRKFTAFTALAVALAIAGGADAAARCKDPKTGKFIKCPPAAASTVTTTKTTTSAAAAGAPASHPPHCVKGKLCGNACIAVTKVCHKP